MRPAAVVMLVSLLAAMAEADDQNGVFTPCDDAKIQVWDGFTFGIAISSRDSFFSNGVQLSPCDSRLSLSSNGAQLAVFRPKIDEISLLTIDGSGSPWVANGGYMVAFAGRKYAARSFPTFVGNSSYVITSFTLVFEFQKGILQNLHWKKDDCASCSGKFFVCLDDACAIRTSNCKNRGGRVDCSIGIQLAFSGTDKYDTVLNSWYEVSNLRQYSLYGLYSDLRGSLTKQFDGFFDFP